MNPEVGDINDPPDHLTCIPSALCIKTSGLNILFQFWSNVDYVMLKKNLQKNCNLIYHDLRIHDTMTIPQKMNKI